MRSCVRDWPSRQHQPVSGKARQGRSSASRSMKACQHWPVSSGKRLLRTYWTKYSANSVSANRYVPRGTFGDEMNRKRRDQEQDLELFRSSVATHKFRLDDRTIDRLTVYRDLIVSWNERVRLVSRLRSSVVGRDVPPDVAAVPSSPTRSSWPVASRSTAR